MPRQQLLAAQPIAAWRIVYLTLGVVLSWPMALRTMMAGAGQPHAAVLYANTAAALQQNRKTSCQISSLSPVRLPVHMTWCNSSYVQGCHQNH